MRGQKNLPYLREEDLYKYTGSSLGKNEWMSTSKDVQFMPVMNAPPRIRNLEDAEEEQQTTGSWEQFDPYSVQPFVEGMSEYDEYQQAWRMLVRLTCVYENGGDYVIDFFFRAAMSMYRCYLLREMISSFVIPFHNLTKIKIKILLSFFLTLSFVLFLFAPQSQRRINTL